MKASHFAWGEGVARAGKIVRVGERPAAGVVRRVDVDQVESALVRPLQQHEGGEVVALDQVVGFPVTTDAQRLDLPQAEVGPRRERLDGLWQALGHEPLGIAWLDFRKRWHAGLPMR